HCKLWCMGVERKRGSSSCRASPQNHDVIPWRHGSTVLFHSDPRTHDPRRSRSTITAGMRNCAYDGTDKGRTLINAIWPGQGEIPNVIVYPLFAVHDAFALKTYGEGIAVIGRPFQRQLPAGAVDQPRECVHWRRIYTNVAAAKFQVVKGRCQSRVVQKATIRP